MHIRLPLALVLLLAVFPAAAVAQLRERIPQMSIAELFATGGEPTGDMYMKGMPWPIDELLKRDRATVTDTAWQCLSQSGTALHSHAFCVSLLVSLRPSDLDQRLLALYPDLDALGRHEVLLHALDEGNMLFSGLFVDILSQLAATEVLDRLTLLAAAYALQVHTPELAEALAEVDTTTLQTEQPFLNTTLDGFPYSDVVRWHVPDPLALVDAAKTFNSAYGNLLARAMTAEEEALLRSYRERMETLQTLPFGVQPGSLAQTLQQLSTQYAWLNFSDISRTVRFSDLQTTLAEAPRTYTEVMAELCNREPLAFFSDTLVPFSWSVSEYEDYSGYVVEQPCMASGGYLFRLYPLLSERNGNASLGLSVQVAGPVGWLTASMDFGFRLDSVEAEGGTLPLTSTQRLPGVPYLTLDLGSAKPEELGSLTLKGTATLHLPTSLRIVEADLVGQDTLELVEGPLRLSYSKTADQVLYEWGFSDFACCNVVRRSKKHPPLSIGVVQLFDTSGVLQQHVSLAGGTPGLNRRLGFRLLDLGHTSTFQPGKLVWIFAPTVETIEVPVVFEQVRFLPRQPEYSLAQP
jgi:hypothetical protein